MSPMLRSPESQSRLKKDPSLERQSRGLKQHLKSIKKSSKKGVSLEPGAAAASLIKPDIGK